MHTYISIYYACMYIIYIEYHQFVATSRYDHDHKEAKEICRSVQHGPGDDSASPEGGQIPDIFGHQWNMFHF